MPLPRRSATRSQLHEPSIAGDAGALSQLGPAGMTDNNRRQAILPSARASSCRQSARDRSRLHRAACRWQVRRLHAGRAARDAADAGRAADPVARRALWTARALDLYQADDCTRSASANPSSTGASKMLFRTLEQSQDRDALRTAAASMSRSWPSAESARGGRCDDRAGGAATCASGSAPDTTATTT